jgi:hypothetical protein
VVTVELGLNNGLGYSGDETHVVSLKSVYWRVVSYWFSLLLVGYASVISSLGGSFTVLPPQVKLSGSAAHQQIILQRAKDGRLYSQITNGFSLSSADTNVARVEGDGIFPVGNGLTEVTADFGGEKLGVKVLVEGADKPFEWSFRNHVQPVLAKTGCSSGACHGAAAGQNGFKLSLRGYDDEADFLALTRQAMGRRVIPSDPGRSLLLLKPTGAVPHKGGKRFEVDSLDYRVLSDWIASGTPGPKTDETRIARLEVFPSHVILEPGAEQQMLVQAHFTDGHVEDVTRWVKYTAANASVAQVEETGRVKIVGYGEGAITAWYLSRISIATVTVPYANQVAPDIFAQPKRPNFIDDRVLEKLAELNLPPSPRCSDEEFIRRAFLDTIGTLPTAQETRNFLATKSENKRDDLIEALLKRPEFVDYWTYRWSDLLLVNGDRLPRPAMFAYYNWIRKQVEENTPWNQFVRRIVTAKGSTLENGAGNFFALHEDPANMAETTTQAFLGMSINCAKCHNHPMEKWTNDEYFGFANLFARVRAKSGPTEGDKVIFVSTSGDLNQPRTGRPQPPRPLDAPALPMDSPADRREALADWLTGRNNPYFSRAVVNRIWKNFFGVGLVENVDDLRVTNPASNEKLLTAAATYLADNQFDLKALMRAILRSETYQRSSTALPENGADTRFYARYYPRRLMAEVLLDGISQVLGVPSEFVTDRRNQNRGLGEKYPLGLRAIQLPDTKIASYFLKSFGRPERDKTCECERTADPNIAQALHLANGETINKKLAVKDNTIGKMLAGAFSREKLLEDAYLGALSRFPTASEKEKLLKPLVEAENEELRLLLEDVFWALLSSKEFLFNH